MDNKNEHKSEAPEELDRAAKELESGAAHQRDGAHLEAERHEHEDLNQGMQTGTHDALRTGIKWGPSYRIKESTADPKKP